MDPLILIQTSEQLQLVKMLRQQGGCGQIRIDQPQWLLLQDAFHQLQDLGVVDYRRDRDILTPLNDPQALLCQVTYMPLLTASLPELLQTLTCQQVRQLLGDPEIHDFFASLPPASTPDSNDVGYNTQTLTRVYEQGFQAGTRRYAAWCSHVANRLPCQD